MMTSKNNKECQDGCVLQTTRILLFVLVIVVLFFSCSTKKHVIKTTDIKNTELTDSSLTNTSTKDTTNVVHVVSVSEIEHNDVQTSVEKSDSVVIMVNTNGEIIKQEIWHNTNTKTNVNHEYQKTLTDSLEKYKNIANSVVFYQQKVKKLEETITELNNKGTENGNTKIPKIYKISLIISILCIIFAFVKLIRWLKTF